MLTTLMLTMLMGAPGPQGIDTVVPAPAGAELKLTLLQADVTVRTWDRREVRVVSRQGGVEVRATNGTVKVDTDFPHGASVPLTVSLTVPSDMPVELSGPTVSVDLSGLEGEVSVTTMHGAIRLEGGRDFVRLHALNGSVDVRGARGRIDVETNNGAVSVTGSTGAIRAHSLNGAVTLRDIASNAVDAYSLNGDIVYDGTIQSGGQYSLSTHAGDVVVSVAADADVAIEASTFGGAFETAFPVTLQKAESGGRTVKLSLGAGSARMKLESFSGTIRLERP